MGLLDVLNGMRNGPRGGQGGASSGGMSPITMAILALLAYKGIKHFGGAQAPQPGGNPARLPDGSARGSGWRRVGRHPGRLARRWRRARRPDTRRCAGRRRPG